MDESLNGHHVNLTLNSQTALGRLPLLDADSRGRCNEPRRIAFWAKMRHHTPTASNSAGHDASTLSISNTSSPLQLLK
jgi:hypothetical protein